MSSHLKGGPRKQIILVSLRNTIGSFWRVKNKLAFFKLADEVEILVQDFYSSLTIIQSMEDLWLAEGTVRQDYDKHASRFNSLAAGHVNRPGGHERPNKGNEEVSHPQCRIL